MNNREFIIAVNEICNRVIADDEGFAQARADVCALVNVEALKPSHNQLKAEIAALLDAYPKDS
jgi:hypothetical protein